MHLYFTEIFELMEKSFPKNEFRNKKEQEELLQNKNYNILKRVDAKDKVIAFMALWKFNNFVFLEHFAVDPKFRGCGIGSEMLKEFINSTTNDIILEVEPPSDIITKKRIKFYENFEFCLNEYDYYQPPLRANHKPSKLKIMSYKKFLTLQEFDMVKDILYKNVYEKFKL